MATPKKNAKRGVKQPVNRGQKAAPRAAKRQREEPDEHAGPPPERVKCAERTGKGTACPRWALPGSTLCKQHLNPRGGRPTKLTAKIVDEIVSILADGGYGETAAAAAGISKSTFYEWMERGDPAGTKPADAEYRRFREQVEQARAKGEMVRVGQVAVAAKDDWRAAAWMLERENPQRWGGPRSRVARGIHPDDFANGEPSSEKPSSVVDDQLGPDGRPL